MGFAAVDKNQGMQNLKWQLEKILSELLSFNRGLHLDAEITRSDKVNVLHSTCDKIRKPPLDA